MAVVLSLIGLSLSLWKTFYVCLFHFTSFGMAYLLSLFTGSVTSIIELEYVQYIVF